MSVYAEVLSALEAERASLESERAKLDKAIDVVNGLLNGVPAVRKHASVHRVPTVRRVRQKGTTTNANASTAHTIRLGAKVAAPLHNWRAGVDHLRAQIAKDGAKPDVSEPSGKSGVRTVRRLAKKPAAKVVKVAKRANGALRGAKNPKVLAGIKRRWAKYRAEKKAKAGK